MTTALKHRVQLDSHKDIIKVRFICQGGLDRSVGEKPVALVWGICNMLPWGGEAGGVTGRSRENMENTEQQVHSISMQCSCQKQVEPGPSQAFRSTFQFKGNRRERGIN